MSTSLSVFPNWGGSSNWDTFTHPVPQEIYNGQQVGDVKMEAFNVQQATGEDMEVALAHWIAENGSSIVTNSGLRNVPGNNLGFITPGDPYVDQHLANGTMVIDTSKGKRTFDTFPDIDTGAKAYAYMIAKDPNYTGVRAAIATGDPSAEIAAIGHSQWGTSPALLSNVYNELKNSNKNAKTGEGGSNSYDYISGTANTVGKVTDTINATGGIVPYIQSLPWIRILVVVLGSVLILLTLYKIATK